MKTAAKQIAIAVVEHAGRVLIGQREAGVPLAGLWEFPGGKLQPGETAEAAAKRECLEETGLEIEIDRLDSRIEHRYPHGEVMLHFFRCHARDPAQSTQARFRWVPLGELDRFEFPAANADLVRRLCASGRLGAG